MKNKMINKSRNELECISNFSNVENQLTVVLAFEQTYDMFKHAFV